MNTFEQKEKAPSLSLADVPPIENGSPIIATKEQLKTVVEAPLLAACEALYDKNIRTLASSANRKNIQNGEASILVDFDSLSEENKIIARKISEPEQASGHGGGGKTFVIAIPVSASSTVAEISKAALTIAQAFKWQPATWITKKKIENFTDTMDQLKETFCLESPEYDDPHAKVWQRLGYVYDPEKQVFLAQDDLQRYFYDPETESYYHSEELCQKAKQKSDPREPSA